MRPPQRIKEYAVKLNSCKIFMEVEESSLVETAVSAGREGSDFLSDINKLGSQL